jgi:hypothetical protein
MISELNSSWFLRIPIRNSVLNHTVSISLDCEVWVASVGFEFPYPFSFFLRKHRMQTSGLNLSVMRFSLGDAMRSVAVTLVAMGVLVSPSALAQQAPAPRMQIFEDITLSPNFSPDPTTIRGISGGPLAASDVTGRTETATGPCSGFIDEQPDHTMVLTQFFNYLSLQVQSPEDTTLVIRGPGGSWCNDDYESRNPGIAGQWLSGTYEIWVGSYEQDSYSPYVIRITEAR